MLQLLYAACLTPPVPYTPPPATPAPAVEATLLADGPPSGPFHVALRLRLPEGWHIYWLNPGETGLATSANLDPLPEFIVQGPHWPGPERFVSPGEITSYGWSGEVVAVWTLQPTGPVGPATAQATARASVSWLACKEQCVKGEAHPTLSLGGSGPYADLSEALGRLPRPATSWAGAGLRWGEDGKTATLTLPGARDAELFPGADLELALAGAEKAEAERAVHMVLRFKERQNKIPFGLVRVTTPSGPPVYLELESFPLES